MLDGVNDQHAALHHECCVRIDDTKVTHYVLVQLLLLLLSLRLFITALYVVREARDM
jgi:hypothetical protein